MADAVAEHSDFISWPPANFMGKGAQLVGLWWGLGHRQPGSHSLQGLQTRPRVSPEAQLSTGESSSDWFLLLQVSPFPDAYRETLHAYKISEQDTDVRSTLSALPVHLLFPAVTLSATHPPPLGGHAFSHLPPVLCVIGWASFLMAELQGYGHYCSLIHCCSPVSFASLLQFLALFSTASLPPTVHTSSTLTFLCVFSLLR